MSWGTELWVSFQLFRQLFSGSARVRLRPGLFNLFYLNFFFRDVEWKKGAAVQDQLCVEGSAVSRRC